MRRSAIRALFLFGEKDLHGLAIFSHTDGK